jgi:hypothetical protein
MKIFIFSSAEGSHARHKSLLIFRSITPHPLTFECNRHTVPVFMSNPIFPHGNSSYIALTEQSGQWLPFVHFADNLLHLLKLPDVFDFDSFTDVPCGGPTPMPDSPIAVVGWGTDHPQASVYLYVCSDRDSHELAGARVLFCE